MDSNLPHNSSHRPVWRGLLSLLGAAALTLAAPAGATSTSADANTRTQDLPAALQLPFYQALAADTDVRFDNGCANLHTQKLTGCFNAAGASFNGLNNQSLALRLTGYGRGTALAAVTPNKPVITGNRVRYEHGQITEWWQVLPMGFEQGFTVTERIDGQGDLVLALAGSQPAALEDGTLSFGDLRYGKLVVSDANGHVVPSTFKTQGKRVLIAVNDTDAAYPLTVDPLVWIEQKVAASDGAGDDEFGYAVATAGDTAVVSTHNGGIDQGAAYVFTRSNGRWSQQAKLAPSDGTAQDNFGLSVAVADDTIIVGADTATVGSASFQGKVYVFTRAGSTWSEQAILTASDGAFRDNFGRSVAVAGDTAVIGASSAGVGGNSNQGAAYVFTRSGSAWSQQVKLTASDGAAKDFFGSAVAFAGDTAVIGASLADVGGSTNEGAVYVFTRSGSAWSQQAKLTASDGARSDSFATSVGIADDTIIAGADGADIAGNSSQGAAYVFTRAGSTWSQQAKLTASDGATSDRFGQAVALAGDTALIGTNRLNIVDNSKQGKAYIFTRTGGTWNENQVLAASDGAGGNIFGNAVALAGSHSVIGAYHAGVDDNEDQGAAYFYGAANLDLAVSAPGTVDADDNYTAQAIVTNNAGDDSPALTALIPVPASTSFVSANATQGSCSQASGTVTCAFGAVPGNAGRATANVTLKATGGAGTTLDSSASIARATPELSASMSTTVNASGGDGGAGSGNTSPPDSVGGGGGCTLAATPGAPDPTLPLLGLLAALTLYRRRASARLQRQRR